MTTTTQTPVLIVGGGYAGLASALFLAHQGVRCVLVDRHPGGSILGRARGINPRTMEIYRPLGLEAAIKEAGRPFDGESGVARCTTLLDEWHWIFDADAPRALPHLTAGEFGLADQSTMEPILARAARERGAELRFDTQCESVDDGPDGVTVVTRDRTTGERRTYLAQYVIAADGYRGTIRQRYGIGRTGPGVQRSYVSCVFKADLSDIITRRAMFWILGDPVTGALVSHALPHHWGLGLSYDPATESPDDFTDERCAETARRLIGRDVPIDIVGRAAWEEAAYVADRFRAGRVFLVGDAAHVWPPAGGLGANSAVQDAHNLAWKLAAVLAGRASDALLDTYEAERRPVALELADLTVRSQAARFGPNPGEDPLDAVLCVLGQRYTSAAMIGPGPGAVFGDGVEQHARPGTRAPHLWLDHDGRRIGVHDLFHDSFVLLTDSEPWAKAAADVEGVRAYRIGADVIDVEHAWRSRYDGAAAVLVRPDGYVAWRGEGDPAALAGVLGRVLLKQ
ncbi:Polyketide hydroxylase WhiE VIII [[Actinomadura] parvosata subsp. kistnae]|uniref:FAD-binding monooxygenase n=1 Tax=[Actinomadura] parvosata subsp. kistnae TaxID=1909395 RepID=A0A1V0A7B6_9ACTN|nr:FAD-dependent oxidoreductase [Nonomuraea sp. ATCC 55076]AQZ66042.1 FAD-binding monooxygenase [Nonomuraea sp. ATCC 55076]SPL97518.1 Polyketide hydroxylase WhiE VIII [Actinomadura parvosata subsp. kistnae]